MDPIEQELTKKLSDLHLGKLTNTPLTRGNTSWELEQELARKLTDVRNTTSGSRLSTRAVNLPISLLQTKDLLIWEKERGQVMGLPETGADLVLRGYKLFFVEEWLWSNKRPWSLVMDAGAMDSIRVRKYALPKLSAVQQKRTVKGLALNEQGFTLKQTEHGSISVYSESNPLGLPLVQCPDGDFDRYVSEFSTQLTLKRLSCCDTINFVGTVSRNNFIEAYREYLPESTTVATVDSALVSLVAVIKAAVVNLRYLPLSSSLSPANLDKDTLGGIRAFQSDYNRRTGGPRLPAEGRVDLATVKALESQVHQLQVLLSRRGFPFEGNPFVSFEEFRGVVVQFDIASGRYQSLVGESILLELLSEATTGQANRPIFDVVCLPSDPEEQYAGLAFAEDGRGCLCFDVKMAEPSAEIRITLNTSRTDVRAKSRNRKREFYHFAVTSYHTVSLRKNHLHIPPVAEQTFPNSAVSALRHWVSFDAVSGWVLYGTGIVRRENIVLKYCDPEPLRDVRYFGFAAGRAGIEYRHLRLLHPLYFQFREEVDVHMLQNIQNLEATIDHQNMYTAALQSNFEELQANYEKVKAQATEMVKEIQKYRGQLEAADRDMELLRREFATANATLKETKDALSTYVIKMKRLEEKIQEVQRKHKQFFLRQWLELVIPWILSAISFVVLSLTYLFSCFRRCRRSPAAPSESLWEKTKSRPARRLNSRYRRGSFRKPYRACFSLPLLIASLVRHIEKTNSWSSSEESSEAPSSD